MIQVMKYKWVYLILSAALLIPGAGFLLFKGLNLSIDFTGGSLFRYGFQEQVNTADLKKVFEDKGVAVESIAYDGNNEYLIRARAVKTEINNEIKSAVSEKYKFAQQLSFETVGPAVGAETTKKAFSALCWAMVGILLYIAYAFRNIPKPFSSFRFGASAIIAMLHDALMVMGVFSILGVFFKTEVDSLFITAVLTVIGFSVHDTIVVFDRIRENLGKLPRAMGFEEISNYSVVETLSRSFATSWTVVMTLFALFILGGESIRTFVLAMLIGVVSGTYSSIFTATPILVIWEEWVLKKKKRG
jgi:preprotein translocase subunit SecF